MHQFINCGTRCQIEKSINMAKPSERLIQAIRHAARNIKEGETYMWGHMGSCNCGHLAQELTHLTKKEIHDRAMQRMGDWNDQCDDFCPTSGFAMDDLIQTMLNAGLEISDLKNLEKLSDGQVLKLIPKDRIPLRHNKKNDVVLYMNTWADMLEKSLLERISLSSLHKLLMEESEV